MAHPMRELNVSNDLQLPGIADHSLSESMFGPIESSMHDGIDMTIFNVVPTHTGVETAGLIHDMEVLDNAVAGGLGDFNMGTGMMPAAWDELDGLAQVVGALPPWDESAFERFMAENPMGTRY